MNKKNNFQILNNYMLDIQKVDSLEKMDEFTGELTEAAGAVYNCISCKTGCYSCCTGPSLPAVYAKEWQRVREYIKTLPEEQKKEIFQNVEEYFERHNELLEFVHKMVMLTATKEELFKYARSLVHDLKQEKCPLHINGKCSVYEVRPTKCRAFGYFSFVHENQVMMLTCESDNKKMAEHLEQQKTRQLSLPFWNSVERKLQGFAGDKSEPFDISVIPYWIKIDMETGKL